MRSYIGLYSGLIGDSEIGGPSGLIAARSAAAKDQPMIIGGKRYRMGWEGLQQYINDTTRDGEKFTEASLGEAISVLLSAKIPNQHLFCNVRTRYCIVSFASS